LEAKGVVEELAVVDAAAASDSECDAEYEEHYGADDEYHEVDVADTSPRQGRWEVFG
jgi:hypothetical protein